jgi:hypothetical protein
MEARAGVDYDVMLACDFRAIKDVVIGTSQRNDPYEVINTLEMGVDLQKIALIPVVEKNTFELGSIFFFKPLGSILTTHKGCDGHFT